VRFAAGQWLLLLGSVPVLWLFMRWGDGRARRLLAALLGPRAGEHVEHMPPSARQWRRFFLLAGIALLILALARPQWGAHEVVVQQRGTDVVIALDISNSMRAEDVVPSRLARARAELGTFLETFDRGRIGLVLFAGQAFVQCPLTLDLGTARLFLRMADPDMISAQGTALESALSVSADLLVGGAGESAAGVRRAILLATDGEDLEGGWQDAAEHCRELGITVIPIGVGEETGGLIPLPGDTPEAAGYLKDAEGNVVMSRLDLASLQRLADYGEGVVFRIGAQGLDSETLQALVAGLGERELDGRHITQYEERFVWPLILAFASLWARTLVRARSVRRSPMVPAFGLAFLVLAIAPAPATAAVLTPPGAAAVTRGLESYRTGDYETALEAFLEARALDPDDPRLALAVGEAMSRLERHEEAAREFSRVMSLTDDPELRAEALYNAGTDALAAGDPARALEQLRRALNIEPERIDTLRNLEYAMRLLEQPPPEQSQESQDGQQGDQDDQPQDGQQNQHGEQQQDGQQQEQQGEAGEQQEGQRQEQSQPEPQQAEDAPPESAESAQEDAEEISQERALSILKALDRDEEELRRSLQKRLKGREAASGKRW